ncbi:F-box/LRR-repeat protein [Thalictrum thalictroides]|uniref:F-box/LRR-repeat protein n=1 Tax=Thalictrum thalictroides TaxID=46969 RepID=A0A7J6V3X7_THATH|nr:F-box/LRR-repeat protein [Thalictrum thalictroides]
MEEKQSQCLRFYTRKRKKNMSDLTTTSDKLSALPESLLHLILSFLDIKQVVQTSCLSTKWRNIWRSVPVLNIDYHSLTKESEKKNISSKEKFMDIVDRVLFLRDDSGIQKLKFFRFFPYDLGRVDALLLFVIKRQVKEILLQINPPITDYHQLPHLLFTSVIEMFEISTLSSRYSVQLPNSMCSATHLRILKLENIKLPEGDLNGELVISCPILEEMLLIRCFHHGLKNLSICAPQLNKLAIYDCHAASGKIKICTPNLTSLKLKYVWYKDYFLESLSSLVTATIEVRNLSTKFLMNILNGLHNARTLKISGYGHKTSPGCADLLDQGLNTCSNLRCLKFIDFPPPYITILLKLFPHIETLTFAFYFFKDMEEDWGKMLSMQNMFSHLKYIRVRRFNGCESEVKLIEYLLKTAPGLQSMTVTSCKIFLNSKQLDECTEKLHSLPRASSSAILLIT